LAPPDLDREFPSPPLLNFGPGWLILFCLGEKESPTHGVCYCFSVPMPLFVPQRPPRRWNLGWFRSSYFYPVSEVVWSDIFCGIRSRVPLTPEGIRPMLDLGGCHGYE
jgi:hypothetical protein